MDKLVQAGGLAHLPERGTPADGKGGHPKKAVWTARPTHSQTGSGTHVGWGLREDLSQEVSWTRSWKTHFLMFPNWG